MVKYCKNCGHEVDDDSDFCSECGFSFNGNKSLVNQLSEDNPFNTYKVDMISGESVIRSSQIHIGCLYLPLIAVAITFFIMVLSGFLLVILFVIAMIWLLVRFIGYSNNDLILTNKRVFGKCGLISTTQMQSPLNKIDTVSFSNGLIGKLIGYGTVEIATTSTHFKFRYIRDGQTFYNDIFNQLENSQKEKRLQYAKDVANALKD